MSYKKQHFITYGDDRPNAVNRIKKQAESFNTFSTINSVSGLGINISFVTKNSELQKDFLFVKYAIGFPVDLFFINLFEFSSLPIGTSW